MMLPQVLQLVNSLNIPPDKILFYFIPVVNIELLNYDLV